MPRCSTRASAQNAALAALRPVRNESVTLSIKSLRSGGWEGSAWLGTARVCAEARTLLGTVVALGVAMRERRERMKRVDSEIIAAEKAAKAATP